MHKGERSSSCEMAVEIAGDAELRSLRLRVDELRALFQREHQRYHRRGRVVGYWVAGAMLLALLTALLTIPAVYSL